MQSATATVNDIVELRSGVSRVFEEIVEQRRTVSGVYVSPESSLQTSAVLCCVRVLSESIASLPFHLYRRLPGGGKEIASDHPLYELLAYQPNDWMTSFEWRELMQSHMLLWGNAYSWIKPGRRGAVDQLIPLHPSRMKITRLENGRLRYEYLEEGKSSPTNYRQDDIFHLRWLSSDGVTGYIPTTLSREAIALARATEIHSSAFFGNFARAGTVIETDQPHKPETLQNLREQWNEIHRGPEAAYKTTVLPHGMHIKERTINNDTAQLVQTRRYSVEEIARAYRVPLSMLGDLTNVRYSTAEQAAIDFVTFSLIPHLRRWEMVCRRDLVVDDANYFCEFDVTALMAGDYSARSQFIREMANLGALDIDEIRSAIGYNPLPDGEGKKRFIQVNMQLLSSFTPENPTASGPEGPPAAAAGEPGEDDSGDDAGSQDEDPSEQPADGEDRSAAETLFRATLRRLASIEADGILERRSKPSKLEQWLGQHEQRMRLELLDAAQATGRDIDAFVTAWMTESRDRLLGCLRSGRPYEEATATWTERANLSDA